MNRYVELAMEKRKQLLKFLRAFVKCRSTAEDLYQDVMESLLRYAPEVQEEEKMDVYLFQCAKMRALRYLGRERKGFTYDVDDEDFDKVDLTFAQLHDGQLELCSDPFDIVSKEQRKKSLETNIGRIKNDTHRELLKDVLVNNEPISSAAESVKISENTARVICHRFTRKGIDSEEGTGRPGG